MGEGVGGVIKLLPRPPRRRSTQDAFQPLALSQDRQQRAEHEAGDPFVARLGKVDDIEIEVVVPVRRRRRAAMSISGAPSSRAMSLTMRLWAALAAMMSSIGLNTAP